MTILIILHKFEISLSISLSLSHIFLAVILYSVILYHCSVSLVFQGFAFIFGDFSTCQVSSHHLVSELGREMVEGMTTRLQKKVSQLQKDMEKVAAKVDGLADQLKGEFHAEISKGFEVLRLKMVKLNQKSPIVGEGMVISSNKPNVIEEGSPISPLQSGGGFSKVVTPSLLGKVPRGLRLSTLTQSLTKEVQSSPKQAKMSKI